MMNGKFGKVVGCVGRAVGNLTHCLACMTGELEMDMGLIVVVVGSGS
jgi:hypothetical protein